jgi:uncharacterized protein YndB with AHSA1/START domain
MSSDRTVRLERLIAAPPELLFSLFTEPEQIVGWWAPDGYEAVVQRFEPRRGGHWRISLRKLSDRSELAVSGTFRIVDPPQHLVFSWTWHQPDATSHETEVDIHFERAPGGTRLLLTHGQFESTEASRNHDAGWSASLHRIKHIVATKGNEP